MRTPSDCLNDKFASQLKKFSYFGLNEQTDIYKSRERSALLEESRGKLKENRLNSPTFKIGSQVFGNNSKINVNTISFPSCLGYPCLNFSIILIIYRNGNPHQKRLNFQIRTAFHLK